jgi:2-iminobutanoate/2-iminopropanoate deaminase
MDRRVIHTPKVPPARVPLSQAIRAGDWIFASGQLGNDPRTGKLAGGGIAAETRQVCENFPTDPPARTTFQCGALVAGARVEIEAIAVV